MKQYCGYCQIGVDSTQVKNNHCNNCGHEVFCIDEPKNILDKTIQFEIKLNAGKQKGEIVFVQTDIEELQEEDLSSILIRHGYLQTWYNNDEYTVINREFI